MKRNSTKPADAQGTGIVKAIDTGEGAITLQHEVITSIDWPAMTDPVVKALLRIAGSADECFVASVSSTGSGNR